MIEQNTVAVKVHGHWSNPVRAATLLWLTGPQDGGLSSTLWSLAADSILQQL